MKKHLLLIIGIAFSLSLMAQLPNGSVAPDFTVTDVNGNEHRLYGYLDDGYTVIIDISATWCGPCWNYHAGGTFEEIWEAHGPAGEPGVSANTTDDVMILWFEEDPNTGVDQLVNSSAGNWLNPNGEGEVQFPMINDDNIRDLYALPYWPIIYTICPSKRLTETGQANAQTHYSNIANCTPATVGNNASIVSSTAITIPEGCTESAATGNVTISVQNFGTEVINSFDIEAISDGLLLATESFNGTLETYDVTTVEFQNLTISSDVEFVITSDDDNSDNSLTQFYSFSGETNKKVIVKLLTDNYASEIYLEIIDEDNNVVWSEGNEDVAGDYGTGDESAPTDPTNPLVNNQSYEWEVNLYSVGCFNFFIGDYYGDGLNAAAAGGIDGSWSIENQDGELLAQMANVNYQGSDEAYFKNNEISSINENENISFTIYPNPARDNAKLTINSKVYDNHSKLSIINVLGEVVSKVDVKLNEGINEIPLELENLSNGLYSVELTSSSLIISQKFIKVD